MHAYIMAKLYTDIIMQPLWTKVYTHSLSIYGTRILETLVKTDHEFPTTSMSCYKPPDLVNFVKIESQKILLITTI